MKGHQRVKMAEGVAHKRLQHTVAKPSTMERWLAHWMFRTIQKARGSMCKTNMMHRLCFEG